MPTTVNVTMGSADAAPEISTRSGSAEPGARPERPGQAAADDGRGRGLGAPDGAEIRARDEPPRLAARRLSDTLSSVTSVAGTAGHQDDRPVAADDGHLAHFRQTGDIGGERGRVRASATLTGKRVGRDDAHVVAGVSSISRNDTSSPGDSISMSNSSAPITATPAIASAARAGSAVIVRHASAPRRHRRISDTTLRRSSVHDAARPATTPSGTAKATAFQAIDGVTRTNTSVVS